MLLSNSHSKNFKPWCLHGARAFFVTYVTLNDVNYYYFRNMNKTATQQNSLLNNWRIWLVLSLTLGLAPFVPEPHLWGKLKWIAGGAEGMALMDWLDALMHGAPWLLFIRALFIAVRKKK